MCCECKLGIRRWFWRQVDFLHWRPSAAYPWGGVCSRVVLHFYIKEKRIWRDFQIYLLLFISKDCCVDWFACRVSKFNWNEVLNCMVDSPVLGEKQTKLVAYCWVFSNADCAGLFAQGLRYLCQFSCWCLSAADVSCIVFVLLWALTVTLNNSDLAVEAESIEPNSELLEVKKKETKETKETSLFWTFFSVFSTNDTQPPSAFESSVDVCFYLYALHIKYLYCFLLLLLLF